MSWYSAPERTVLGLLLTGCVAWVVFGVVFILARLAGCEWVK